MQTIQPAVQTIIQKIESQSSMEIKWGKPVQTLKIYFSDNIDLKERLDELIEWGYIPNYVLQGGEEDGREQDSE